MLLYLGEKRAQYQRESICKCEHITQHYIVTVTYTTD